jgi:hypothetical protein
MFEKKVSTSRQLPLLTATDELSDKRLNFRWGEPRSPVALKNTDKPDFSVFTYRYSVGARIARPLI